MSRSSSKHVDKFRRNGRWYWQHEQPFTVNAVCGCAQHLGLWITGDYDAESQRAILNSDSQTHSFLLCSHLEDGILLLCLLHPLFDGLIEPPLSWLFPVFQCSWVFHLSVEWASVRRSNTNLTCLLLQSFKGFNVLSFDGSLILYVLILTVLFSKLGHCQIGVYTVR